MTPPETTVVSPTEDGAARRAVARMRNRVRALRAARGAIELGLYGAAFATLVLLGAKLGRIPDAGARRLLGAALLFPLVGALVGAFRRVPELMAAQLLDKAYGLKDRLANALEFAAIPAAERTPMMDAALADAVEQTRARDLRPSRALAWRWPAETAYLGAMLAVLGLVAAVEFRTRVETVVRRAEVASRDPLALSEDDIEAFRQAADEIARQATTEQSRHAAEQFNRFVQDIADQRLDREEAFRRLRDLQADLERSREDDREALREALRDVGQRVDSDVTRQLAQALQQNNPRAAAQAMQQLANQLRENRLNAQQRQQLQQALQRAQQAARRQDDQNLQQQLQRAREEAERLLRQQRERNLAESEQRLLRQRQRDVERLQREQQRREQQRRQVERLQRAMSQAMQDLARDLAQAAQDMEEGAQDLNRMADEQLSEQQIAELRQQLEDLRQRMRQQNGQGGQQQRQRLQRFAGRARGGVQPGGQQGQGQRGRLQLVPGGGGGIPLPGGGGQGQGQQPGGGRGQGNEPGGVEAGTGHDSNLRGAATNLQARMRTVNVSGQQRGNGPTRSQVIRTAAQEGFTGQGYREVHAEYWDHAREVVHAGDVPPGYRSYVRRYFQLIRPRE